MMGSARSRLPTAPVEALRTAAAKQVPPCWSEWKDIRCSSGGGNWGTLRIPREDWGALGKMRGITTPP